MHPHENTNNISLPSHPSIISILQRMSERALPSTSHTSLSAAVRSARSSEPEKRVPREQCPSARSAPPGPALQHTGTPETKPINASWLPMVDLFPCPTIGLKEGMRILYFLSTFLYSIIVSTYASAYILSTRIKLLHPWDYMTILHPYRSLPTFHIRFPHR